MEKKEMETQHIVSEVLLVPCDKIERFPGQPRLFFDEGQLASLKKSIEAVGQRTPISLTPLASNGKYMLTDGERRWRVCKELGRAVKAVIETVEDEEERYLFSATANFGRAEHTPMETAQAIQKVLNSKRIQSMKYGDGAKIEKVADIFVHSVPWVYQYLGLLQLHPRLQERMDPSLPEEKQLKFQVATALSGLPQKSQLEVAAILFTKKFSMKRALNYIRLRKRTTPGTGRKRVPADDYRILFRFVLRLSEESEMILDMKQKDFVDMFKNRPAEDRRGLRKDIVSCMARLNQLRQAIERADAELNAQPTPTTPSSV